MKHLITIFIACLFLTHCFVEEQDQTGGNDSANTTTPADSTHTTTGDDSTAPQEEPSMDIIGIYGITPASSYGNFILSINKSDDNNYIAVIEEGSSGVLCSSFKMKDGKIQNQKDSGNANGAEEVSYILSNGALTSIQLKTKSSWKVSSRTYQTVSTGANPVGADFLQNKCNF